MKINKEQKQILLNNIRKHIEEIEKLDHKGEDCTLIRNLYDLEYKLKEVKS